MNLFSLIHGASENRAKNHIYSASLSKIIIIINNQQNKTHTLYGFVINIWIFECLSKAEILYSILYPLLYLFCIHAEDIQRCYGSRQHTDYFFFCNVILCK